ncbi:Gamma-glutamylcyclotransferase [Escovopsis weberi]|uniref:gamma-glutamylcyclotransferase n=1 Tax=Escovopsis weberi TaxID=150374 RepID=A0A0M8N668_ESCWE|nr:Gamma-glutamylcyclotransferase [Escovopsis weberi]
MATSGPPRPERQQPQKGNPPPTKYYFAYGSNLCLNQMKKRCPNSRYIGTARLSNHLWHINERGYANVKAAEGHWVEGLVYEIDEADEASLDTYEGVSKNAYHKCLTRVLLQKAPGALYRRPVAWIVNQGGPAEVSRKTESADKAAPRPDVPPQVAANTLTYINLALTGESHPKKEYVKRMNLGISDAVALGIGEDYANPAP